MTLRHVLQWKSKFRGEPEEPDDVILVLLHVYEHRPSLDFDFASRVRFIPLPSSKITFNPNCWTFPNEIIRTDFAKKQFSTINDRQEATQYSIFSGSSNPSTTTFHFHLPSVNPFAVSSNTISFLLCTYTVLSVTLCLSAGMLSGSMGPSRSSERSSTAFSRSLKSKGKH